MEIRSVHFYVNILIFLGYMINNDQICNEHSFNVSPGNKEFGLPKI